MAKRPEIAELLKYSDPREVPSYTVAEAAHYLSIPKATLRSWVMGTSYKHKNETRQFRHVIDLPEKDSSLLSFFNLAEAHVLRALRESHGVTLPAIRNALEFVSKRYGWERPLIQQRFKTDGIALFIDELGKLLDVSAGGQHVIREVMEAHLERLDWENEVVARLYPFTRLNGISSPKSVFIDPRYSFGRPLLRESFVSTSIVAERYKAGESIEELAADYECSHLEIEEGVRCELRISAAA